MLSQCVQYFVSLWLFCAIEWLTKALCYKPEIRGFHSRWDHCIFSNWPNPSSRTMVVGSTQPLTEMSTRNISGGEVKGGRRLRLTTSSPHLWVNCLQNVGASTSHNPMGLHDCYRDSFIFVYVYDFVTRYLTLYNFHSVTAELLIFSCVGI
jgi:hypothetical protein